MLTFDIAIDNPTVGHVCKVKGEDVRDTINYFKMAGLDF